MDASTVSTAMYAFFRPCAVQSSSSTCGSSTADAVVATTDTVTTPGGTPWPLVKRAAACRAACCRCQLTLYGITRTCVMAHCVTTSPCLLVRSTGACHEGTAVSARRHSASALAVAWTAMLLLSVQK